jgi:hypothetical protein
MMMQEGSLKKHQLRPGDVLLFSGDTPIHRLVQKLTRSLWTQVGLVLHLPNSEELSLLEATSIPNSPDIDTGAYTPGVRTTPLSARLLSFKGVVASRSLCPQLESKSIERFVEFRRTVFGRPFDFSLLSARKSIRRSHTEWSPISFSCSSLVTYAYQSIGVIQLPPEGPLPNNVVPSDYATEGNLKLMAGYAFDDMNLLQDSSAWDLAVHS